MNADMLSRQTTESFPLQPLLGHGAGEMEGNSTVTHPRHPMQAEETDAFLPSPDIPAAPSARLPSTEPAEERRRSGQLSPSTKLHRSAFVLLLVFFYALLALFAWILTCILTVRPITGPDHYDLYVEDSSDYGYLNDGTPLYTYYAKNENWFRAARVIQSIVSILTIPLTSAVCSSAAVVFIQQNGRSNLTLRQLMTFSDKAWADPATYARSFMSWKRYGSSLLIFAMTLNGLGFVISPLQEIFLGSDTIKTPTFNQQVQSLLDTPDQFRNSGSELPDNNLIVVLTRNALMTASQIQPQAQLWQGGSNATCDTLKLLQANEKANKAGKNSTPLPDSCGRENILGNIAKLDELFLAELSSGYSTGLIRQFIPRINSTATYENITGTPSFPAGCDQNFGSFYAEYSDNIKDGNNVDSSWSIQACMPGELTASPWKNTRDRQDFSEELYLNITISDLDQHGTPPGGWQYKVSVNTTAGYFELPNYMNGAVPGPLLEKDPNGVCGHDCYTEGINLIYTHDLSSKHSRRSEPVSNDFNSSITNSSLSLERLVNKGPLLTTAMALFGSGSFLANRIANPKAFWGVNDTDSLFEVGPHPPNQGSCIDLAPMGRLLQGDITTSSYTDNCIVNTAGGIAGQSLGDYMMDWIRNFIDDDIDGLTTAFSAAAFLANQAWMMNNVEPDFRSLSISFDYGADTQVPTISRAGMILISVLLGIDLIALLAMGTYASLSVRWTNQLDSFAMMRLGASMADKVPLLIGLHKDKIKILDELPGSIGDASEDNEKIGRLGLGGSTGLSKRRRYECYEEDREPVSASKKKISENTSAR